MSESKNSSIVDLVQEFCLSSSFEKEFEEFAEEYQHVFNQSTEFKQSSEHPLEFYDVYKEYLTRFEKRIEDFIKRVTIVINTLTIVLTPNYTHVYRRKVILLMYFIKNAQPLSRVMKKCLVQDDSLLRHC